MKISMKPLVAGVSLAALAVVMGAGLAVAEGKHSRTSWHFGSFDSSRDFYWAVVERDADGDLQMSGSVDHRDWELLDELAEGRQDALLWFRLDGQSYMTRDGGTIEQAREIVAPMQELGRRQGALGRKQGALGRQQGEIGREQGRLGARQGRLGASQGILARDLARAERRGENTRALEREMREIEAQMEALGDEQQALARKQEPFAEQQEIIGRQQEELGRQQEAASRRAESSLRTLARELIRQGRTESVKG